MGIEIELVSLFALCAVSSSVFDKFEAETPVARKLLRWLIAAALTLGPYPFVGHWSLVPLAAFAVLGLSAHVIWCLRNKIHPLTATPRRRYYQLRGWTWPED